MPQRYEMLHQDLYTFYVIHPNHPAAGSVKLAGYDYRHIIHNPVYLVHIFHIRNQPGYHPVDEDYGLHLQSQHLFKHTDLFRHASPLGLIKNHNYIASFLSRLLTVKEQFRIVGISNVCHHNADQPAPGLSQPLGQGVGSEIVSFHQIHNPAFCPCADSITAVQRSGYSGSGNPRFPGNIVDRNRLSFIVYSAWHLFILTFVFLSCLSVITKSFKHIVDLNPHKCNIQKYVCTDKRHSPPAVPFIKAALYHFVASIAIYVVIPRSLPSPFS